MTQEHNEVGAVDPRDATAIEAPPRTLRQTLLRLGPGLIIAGSIVGSGELIATTKTGAQAGMTLLWLIVIGCVIKIFIQIALGRHAVTHGETTLAAMDRVPGPRWRANWIVWFWLAMMAASTAQLGGIVQGVGQSLAMTIPLKGDFVNAVKLPTPDELIALESAGIEFAQTPATQDPADIAARSAYAAQIQQISATSYGEYDNDLRSALSLALQIHSFDSKLESEIAAGAAEEEIERLRRDVRFRRYELRRVLEPYTLDDKIWAGIATLATILMLYLGRYRLVQNFTMAMVALFTFVVVGTVVGLHVQNSRPELQLSLADWLRGFGWPEAQEGISPLATALATFGIIGVGSAELVAYPYWCLEKGYARFTGPRTDDPGWADRAAGWIRVMRIDAWLSLVVYTTATVAFFVLGATVLHRQGLDPEGMHTVNTLKEQFVPIFGRTGGVVFLVGAVCVLYSTFLVANAGNARSLADSFIVLGLTREEKRQRWVSLLCVALPLTSYVICLGGYDPVALVLFAGVMQALMLPLLGIAAVWLRYRESDSRLKPSVWGDVLLLLSLGGALIAGGWLLWSQIARF